MTSSSVASHRQTFILGLCAAVVLICFAYANHFENSFHFDDTHTVQENPFIRDLHNIPKFFTDPSTFSTLPPNRSYRPLVTTSLAIDYWLGHGLHPLWFHITTFCWFLTQLGLMFTLFRATLRNEWLALFGTAIYGVHPAIAETVNYVIQRSDIYSTLGVVAGLAIYAQWPGVRHYGLYLLPVAAGIFSKPPAIVFPALLFTWIWFFEEGNPRKAAIRTLPSAALCGALAWFTAAMNPASYVTGATSPFLYRITQPFILLGYFRKFFIPTGLSADTDQVPFTDFNNDAFIGFIFVLAIACFIWWCAFGAGKARKELRPVAFGLFWFLAASAPTSWIALAEVENDHRMYFPFVGLTFAACQAGALVWGRRAISPPVTAAACVAILAVLTAGTRERNRIWHDDDSLWLDVTLKSPKNGRGLMNYGLTRMAKADYAGALDYFNRALIYNPNYYILEINLGIAYGAINRPADAETHFARAIALAPGEVSPRFFYARWLSWMGRNPEAATQLRTAVQLNPDYLDARYLLMQTDATLGDAAGLRTAAQETLARFPNDATAASWLARSANLQPVPVATPGVRTPEGYLTDSLGYFRAGQFQECVDAAKQAIRLRPDYAEAWNNVGACYNNLNQWDLGIQAELKAIQIKPDFQLAKNNLAFAQQSKAKTGSAGR